MEPPPVQFTKTEDGCRIAYTVSGAGRTLVWVPYTFMHVRWSWFQHPEWFEGLARRFRFVHFNYRGHGMSTRPLPPGHTMADWQKDVAAVVDAVSAEPVVLLGVGHSGHMAVRYALARPDRVEALVLLGSSISVEAFPQMFWRDVSRQNWDFFRSRFIPPGVAPEELPTWLARLDEIITPAEHQAHMRAIQGSTLENELPRLRTPTLVLHSRQSIALRIDEPAKLAAAIHNSRLVMTDGASMGADPAQGIAAIESFLAELPQQEEPVTSAAGRSDGLSPREVEVLRLIAHGLSSREIGEALVLSVRTVERHIANIYLKTDTHNRAQATAYALARGLA